MVLFLLAAPKFAKIMSVGVVLHGGDAPLSLITAAQDGCDRVVSGGEHFPSAHPQLTNEPLLSHPHAVPLFFSGFNSSISLASLPGNYL